MKKKYEDGDLGKRIKYKMKQYADNLRNVIVQNLKVNVTVFKGEQTRPDDSQFYWLYR